MKLYEIQNSDYQTKQVAAYNMRDALIKYENYLSEHINLDYSYTDIFNSITKIVYIKEYEPEEIIL